MMFDHLKYIVSQLNVNNNKSGLTCENSAVDSVCHSCDDFTASSTVNRFSGRIFVKHHVIVVALALQRRAVLVLADTVAVGEALENCGLAGTQLFLIQGPHADAHTYAFVVLHLDSTRLGVVSDVQMR